MHNIFRLMYGPKYSFRYAHVNQMQLKSILPGQTKIFSGQQTASVKNVKRKCHTKSSSTRPNAKRKWYPKSSSTSWDHFIVTQGLTCQPSAKKTYFSYKLCRFFPWTVCALVCTCITAQESFLTTFVNTCILNIETYFSAFLEWCKEHRLNKWLVVGTCEALH